MNKLLIFLFSFLLIASCSAMIIYSGETKTLDLSLDFDRINFWNMTGNATELNAFVWNDNMFNITIPEDYTTGTITIHFEGYKNGEERVVTVNQVSSSGSSGSVSAGFYGIVPPNQTVFVNQTQIVPGENITTPGETIYKDNTPIWIRVLAGLFVLLIIIIVILFVWLKRETIPAPKL